MKQKPQTEKSAMPVVLGIAGLGIAGAGVYLLLKGKKPTPPPTGPWTLMTPSPTLLAVKKAIGTAVWQLMTPTATTLVVVKAVGVSGWTLMTPTPTLLAVKKEVGTGNYALTTNIDPAGVGFVERTYLGITRADNYQYPPGGIVTIRAYPYNNTEWVFMYWLTPAGAQLTPNPMDVQMNQNTILTAHFARIQGPPPPTGPAFPAPGISGDGQLWFWIVFTDNSAAWFDQLIFQAIMYISPEMVETYYGPYPSGATS